MNEAVEVLERFSDFLQGVVEQLFKTDTCILLISDHGNIEDLSVKTHTRNPVPFLSIRNNNLKIESNMHSIIQLTAVIKKIISTST
jgi:bisphosphoglycerate-independent phosphoglycerate mutase (AlkP superfamily)